MFFQFYREDASDVVVASHLSRGFESGLAHVNIKNGH